MGLVDAELYEFLRENENHLYLNENFEVYAFAVINFYKLTNFVEAVGKDFFAEERRECLIHDGYITIDLKELIEEHYEQKISDYKKCFDEQEWKRYKDELLRQEEIKE